MRFTPSLVRGSLSVFLPFFRRHRLPTAAPPSTAVAALNKVTSESARKLPAWSPRLVGYRVDWSPNLAFENRLRVVFGALLFRVLKMRGDPIS